MLTFGSVPISWPSWASYGGGRGGWLAIVLTMGFLPPPQTHKANSMQNMLKHGFPFSQEIVLMNRRSGVVLFQWRTRIYLNWKYSPLCRVWRYIKSCGQFLNLYQYRWVEFWNYEKILDIGRDPFFPWTMKIYTDPVLPNLILSKLNGRAIKLLYVRFAIL